MFFQRPRSAICIFGAISCLTAATAWTVISKAQVDEPRAGSGDATGDDPVGRALTQAEMDRAAGVAGWSARMREAAAWSEQLGNKARAAEILAQVLANPETVFDDADAKRMLAQSALMAGRYAESIQHYEASLAALRRTGGFPGIYDPAAASMMNNLSMAYRLNQQLADSERVCDTVLAMDLAKIDRFTAAGALSNKASLASARGAFDEATDALDLRTVRYASDDASHEESMMLARDDFAAKAGLPNSLELRLETRIASLETPGTAGEASFAALMLLEHLQRSGAHAAAFDRADQFIVAANRILESNGAWSASERKAIADLRSTCLSVRSTADKFGHPDHAIGAMIEYIRTDTDPTLLDQHERELDALLNTR